MNSKKKFSLAPAALLVFVFSIAIPVSAQQSADEVTQSNGTLGASIEQTRIEIAEYYRLEAQLAEVEPGFRILLQRRLDARAREIFEQVDALAKELLESDGRVEPTDEYRAQTAQWLQEMWVRANEFLARNRQTILALLEEQSSTDPAKAAEAVVELDRAIELTATRNRDLYRMIERLDELGVDVSEERAQLVTRVREAAEMLAVAIQLDADELAKLRARLALTPDNADLQTLIKVADLRRKSYAENLSSTSSLLSDLDVDSSEYRRLVLLVTGDVASQILDTGVMSGLVREWGVTALSWINDNGLGWAIKLIVFILILMAFRTLSKLTRRWAGRGLDNVQLSVLLRHMIAATAANLVMLFGILIALSQLGISLGPLLAGLGVLGFIIGFALQDTLGNFASGMMILLYRPYDVGDVIDAGGVSGKVEDMTLVYTIIHTFDNQKMVVPNSKIWGDVIKNVTSQTIRRVDLVFGISYGDDIEKTERVLQEVVEAHALTLDDPAPTIKVHTLGDSSVNFIVRPWVKSEDYWGVYWDLTRAVKMRFDEEGISIPFPQRDVHIKNGPSPAA
ncbi:MAG: mechanosensitive ion channel [Gammaproteobacteria bacterium]|nr:mechanosensitive ion channel [Gammaproteobacteria bacterium]